MSDTDTTPKMACSCNLANNSHSPSFRGLLLAVDDIDYFDQLLYIKDPDGCHPRQFPNFNFITMGSPFYYSLETDEYYDFYNCSNVRRLKTGEFGLVPCLSGHDFQVFMVNLKVICWLLFWVVLWNQWKWDYFSIFFVRLCWRKYYLVETNK